MVDPLSHSDPQQIDQYVLEGRLGAGGYGVVYAAVNPDGRRVALKVLRPELADSPGLRERLAREGEALSRVGGERNVEIYDVATEGTYTYLVMELVEGETLQAKVERDGPLTGPMLWFTAQGLLEALEAIHAAGITHRDLKPSNVMFGPDGAKVLDFGISVIGDLTGLTQTGAFLGTAAWISPEQILGREVTEKCDVFNLGLVMTYAATGRHPYGEGRPDAVMYRISNLEADLEGIDEPLCSAIRRCLEREPAIRPTVSELLAFFVSSGQDALPDAPKGATGSTVIVQPSQVEQIVKSARDQSGSSSEPPGDPPVSPGALTPDKPKRRRVPLFAALTVLLLLGGGLAFFLTQDSGDETVAPATTLPAKQSVISTTTTQAPTTTTTQAPTTTTTQAPTTTTTTTLPVVSAAEIAEEAILTRTYVWGPSTAASELQELLGLAPDSWYGEGTRIAHLAVLNSRGLPTYGVPNPPPTTTAAPTTTTRAVTTTEPPIPRYVLQEWEGSRIRWDPCDGTIWVGLNSNGYLDSGFVTQWEDFLRTTTSELARLSGLDLRYSGTTDLEFLLGAEEGGRQVVSILFWVGPPGSHGLTAPGSEEWWGTSDTTWDITNNDPVWNTFLHYEVHVNSEFQAEYANTADWGFDGNKGPIMFFLAYGLGLAEVDSGISTEVMSWGSRAFRDSDWGPGDRIAFDLVGASNGCIDF